MQYIDIPAGMETAAFAMGSGALNELADFVAKVFPGKKPWIIADENTFAAAGKKASEQFTDQYPPYIFPGSPRLHPDSAISDMLAKEISAKPDVVPLAVGSGVINDIVKRASGIANVPYCCVPTASSVDGYTSAGSAMSCNGFKMTLPCPAPYGLLVDTDVLYAAPPEMFASGYADLFAKIPGGADWIIAVEAGRDKIAQNIWDLVQKPLRQRLSDPKDFAPVFAGLADTGYAMQLYKDSRPASGAEHLMSHIWEMEHLSFNGEEVSHGFKVGIGSIASTKLMEFIINTPLETAKALAKPLLTKAEREAEIDRLLIKGCYGSGIKELAMEKFESTPERREELFAIWEKLQKLLPVQLIASDEAVKLLRIAESPVHYTEIGLDEEQFVHGIRTAQLIRKRYTVLDYLYTLGLLDAAIGYVLQ
ncbi:MAG: iron-containing alcohol dehydrogenase [Lentisphaeria bacterium]|nr:iron-containing alcohol dehydrogenase [Lentisphaeria bacterium]